uniref:Grass carp reovirus (GCRV)-induced gene 2e n=1 Tax=Mastacembelus armatus TaxID=205130 RepID=A0A7N8X117_9TELE
MKVQWAEDDFDLPCGVTQLGSSVPEDNRSYVMYHGTTRMNAQSIKAAGFRRSPDGMLGCGVYLSRDLQKASCYPIDHPENDRVVIKVKVNVGKVIAINYQGHPRQKTWHDWRYGPVFDTAWVPPNCGMVPSGLEEDCVWDPNRIQIISVIEPKPVQVNNDFYVMYHGTTRMNAQSIKATGFRRSPDGMLGCGVYLSRDLQKASRYPIDHPENDRVVIKVKVNVGKVIAINYQGHPRQKTWHDWRYGPVFDTAWVPPNCGMVPSGLEEDCVWDPNRIQIISVIEPKPVQVNNDLFARLSRVQWAEDDFDLPCEVTRLGLDSPVNNRSYVMYHGTTRMNAQSIKATGFRQSPDGMLGCGVYLSRDLQKASRYPIDHPENDRVVIKVKVNVGKVIAINYQGHPRQKTWHDWRYGPVFDTAWVPPNCGMVPSGLEEDCVWDPNRIQIIITRLGLDNPVNNKSYVMYHGTTRMNAQSIKATGFRRSPDGMLGCGVYLSRDLQKASRYPIDHPENDRVVIKVKVNVGKVIAINYQGHPRQKTWHDWRYGPVFDTAWVPPNCGMVPSGLEEDCVWDPNRIQIISVIEPKPVQVNNDLFARLSRVQWAEDDFDLPCEVTRLGLDSPVNNRSYVMYHGTTRMNAQSIKATGFRQSPDGMLGCGVYLSRDLQKASRYPIDHPENDRVVIKVKVNVGKVIAINYQGHPRQKTWHDWRYGPVFDTAWVPPNCGMVPSGLEEDCVWDPNQIKILSIIEPKPVQSGWFAEGYM